MYLNVMESSYKEKHFQNKTGKFLIYGNSGNICALYFEPKFIVIWISLLFDTQ